MLPLPEAGQLAPPLPTQVQFTLVGAGARVLVTVAPVALLGPLLPTARVYTTVSPAVTLPAGPVRVTARSPLWPMVSVSVALLLPGFGSVTPAGAETVAVLLNVPVAAGDTVALTV